MQGQRSLTGPGWWRFHLVLRPPHLDRQHQRFAVELGRHIGQQPGRAPSEYGDPRYDRRLSILRRRTESGLSIYGTAYLWTAGLMNLLLLFDVWDIGTGRKL